MTMQSIQLATVSGVVSMIEKVADEAIKNGTKTPAGMMTAMEAVCNLLESRGKGDKAVAGAVAKVRKACGIQKKGTKDESLA